MSFLGHIRLILNLEVNDDKLVVTFCSTRIQFNQKFESLQLIKVFREVLFCKRNRFLDVRNWSSQFKHVFENEMNLMQTFERVLRKIAIMFFTVFATYKSRSYLLKIYLSIERKIKRF